MASALLAWELGGGLGHLTVLRPIADRLVDNGHTVHLATRDLTAAETVFHGSKVHFYQAPIKTGKPIAPIPEPLGYSQLLHNCGFETVQEISGRIKAWDRLFDLIRPDLLVCDHCPTALAAARGRSFRVALVGTGFVNPPVDELMPSLAPWKPIADDVRQEIEQATLLVLNQALSSVDKPAMRRMSELYERVNGTFITSFKELDHFGQRGGVRYWGAWPQFGGMAPQWPDHNTDNHSTAKRVFAYLKRSPGLTDLLTELGRCEHSILVYGSWVTADIQAQYQTATMWLLDKPVDMGQVAQQCDLALLNGTHGATAAMLLSGAPILQLPIFLEQRLLSDTVVRMGAGRVADRQKTGQIMTLLGEMLADPRYGQGARRFAQLYANVNPARQFEKMMHQIDLLLETR